MTSESKRKKDRGGRPAQAVKREVITGVRFTKTEHFIVKHKASKAGLGITLYIRQMALNGQVNVVKMDEEKRQFVRQLIGMSNNLNQIAKRCHKEGVMTAVLHFEKYRQALDELLERLKK